GPDAADHNPSSRNAILGNSIYKNGPLTKTNFRLGIDLGNNGVTKNDSSGHSGPNQFQVFPELTWAYPDSGKDPIGATPHGAPNVSIAGTLSGPPNTKYRVEFFSNPGMDAIVGFSKGPVGDPSGYGQGQTYLGSTDVTIQPDGQVSFDVVLKKAVTF